MAVLAIRDYTESMSQHERLEATITHIESQLSDEVSRLEYRAGPDSEGEPALWIWVVLKSTADESDWSWENRHRLREQVVEALSAADVPFWPYVRFKGSDETTNLKSGKVDSA